MTDTGSGPCRALYASWGSGGWNGDQEAIVPAGSVQWTNTCERTFLEHLALSSNVAASERLPPGAAYRCRMKSADFRRNWETALKEGYDRLELAMLERAINGVTVEVTTARQDREAVAQNDPLLGLLAGHCWIVGSAPAGAWAGQGERMRRGPAAGASSRRR